MGSDKAPRPPREAPPERSLRGLGPYTPYRTTTTMTTFFFFCFFCFFFSVVPSFSTSRMVSPKARARLIMRPLNSYVVNRESPTRAPTQYWGPPGTVESPMHREPRTRPLLANLHFRLHPEIQGLSFIFFSPRTIKNVIFHCDQLIWSSESSGKKLNDTSTVPVQCVGFFLPFNNFPQRFVRLLDFIGSWDCFLCHLIQHACQNQRFTYAFQK